MTVELMPNVEALVSAFLRAQPEMIAIVDDRIYTVLPGAVTYPAVRVNQYDEGNVTSRPLWAVRASIQIEAWGGSKDQAFSILATAQACISERIEGVYSQGVVTGVEWGGRRDLPDPSFSPAKPRWMVSAYITAHP